MCQCAWNPNMMSPPTKEYQLVHKLCHTRRGKLLSTRICTSLPPQPSINLLLPGCFQCILDSCHAVVLLLADRVIEYFLRFNLTLQVAPTLFRNTFGAKAVRKYHTKTIWGAKAHSNTVSSRISRRQSPFCCAKHTIGTTNHTAIQMLCWHHSQRETPLVADFAIASGPLTRWNFEIEFLTNHRDHSCRDNVYLYVDLPVL